MIGPALQHSYTAFLQATTQPALLARVQAENRWFTPGMVRCALEALAPWFDPTAWEALTARYPQTDRPRRVGISMAGNVPLVGLHDLLAVLATGHQAVIKPSRKDRILPLLFVQHLPAEWQVRCRVVDQLLPGEIDFLLATGGGASARALAHQFAGTPQLIRANRWSVALLDGSESDAALQGLAQDMLRYHGMGCRSVCNVLAPPRYDWRRLVHALDHAALPELAPEWQDLVRWEKAVAALSAQPVLASTRLLLEPRTALGAARPGVAHIIEAPPADWPALLASQADALQCITGPGHLPLGQAQCPGLTDFADGVDTFELLSRLDQAKSW